MLLTPNPERGLGGDEAREPPFSTSIYPSNGLDASNYNVQPKGPDEETALA